MSLHRHPLLALLLVALGVHACVLIAVYLHGGRADAYAFASLDCGEYYRLAQNLAHHGVFSQQETPPFDPETWRTPGYPFFLAIFLVLVGDSPVALVVVQQLLSAANVLLLYAVSRRHMSQRRAALVAVVFLFEPYHLYYSTWLMSTTLFITMVLLIWHTWQVGVRRQEARWFARMGLLCGVCVLVRPLSLLIPFVIVLGLAGLGIRSIRRRSIEKPTFWTVRAALVFVVLCASTVGLWMERNRWATGHLSLSSQAGVVLAYFKAAEVVLWRQGRTADRYLETSLDPAKRTFPHATWDEMDRRLKRELPDLTDSQRDSLHWRNLAQGNKTTVDSFEIDYALTRIGVSYLWHAPLATIACYSVRCGSILTFPLTLAFAPPVGMKQSRLRSLLLAFPYVLLCAAVGIRLLRGRWTLASVYFPLATTAALLMASTPQIDPRFRVPMIPLLVFVALLPRHSVYRPVSPPTFSQPHGKPTEQLPGWRERNPSVTL